MMLFIRSIRRNPLRFVATQFAIISMYCLLGLTGQIVFADDAAAGNDGFEPGRLEITTLASKLSRPMEMEIAEDGRLYFIELAGKLNRYDPKSNKVETIGTVEVTTMQENGLIGIALDPKFSENQHLYLQYSPPEYSGQHISRFTLKDGQLDLSSEKLLFKFTEQRLQCCHHAGSMTFGPDGCLYIGTGDNTHPFGDSQSYAPIDERPEREPWDAQKSAANSRSGSGKILRIRPTPEGGYEVPEGNLFPRDGSEGLPEIYVMGCRNPWRINVDQKSGFLYWGEVGPDARNDGPRGPRGYDEINQAKAAGNFGWPYFIANNKRYHDVDFTNGKVGEQFNVQAPINDSPNNTGARTLPPAQPALLYYPSAGSPEFPELNAPGGRTACAGPVYHLDAELASTTKFPAHYDGVLFIYEWSRHWIKAVRLNEKGEVTSIEPFMPEQKFVRPIDMRFGPDGAMYLIEYGTTWGENQDARLIRIDYVRGNRRPVAVASATNNVGREPLEVTLSSEATFDKDPNDKLTFQWRSFRAGDESQEPKLLSTEANPKVLFKERGVYNVELLVTDSSGAVGSSVVPVVVGNSRPEVRILKPSDGDFYEPGQPIDFKIYVRDAEDGTSDFDEAEDHDDIDFLDRESPARVTLNASLVSPTAGADDENAGPPGLQLMKKSDCFNCHDVRNKRVGPPLIKVAEKYRKQSGALEASVQRVRKGSTGVWGKVPMIPHLHHTDDELVTMVSWIYSLESAGGLEVVNGFVGAIPANKNAAKSTDNVLLEANYIDLGVDGIPPLAESTKIVVRNRRVDAELANEVHGAQTLKSGNAHGGQFLGAINHGNYARINRVNLDQVAAISARVTSAGAGGRIEVRLDKPDGERVALINVQNNGSWDKWHDVKESLKEAKGTHDLFMVFTNPLMKSSLMNVDSFYFHP